MKTVILFSIVAVLAGCDQKPPAEPPKELTKGVPPEIAVLAPTPIPKAIAVSPSPTPVEIRVPLSPQRPTHSTTPSPTPKKLVPGSAILRRAEEFIGVTERPGNRGAQIDEWNQRAGVPMGSPYCGSFAGAMHRDTGAAVPAGYAYTPSWFNKNLVSFDECEPGDVVGFYYPEKGRIAHIGIIKNRGGTYTGTVEANTSYDARAGSASDREGDGVHSKLRSTKLLTQGKNRFARYR